MDWSFSDFVFAGALLSGLGLAVWFVARAGRVICLIALAVGVAVVAALLMVWVTGAVGIVVKFLSGTRRTGFIFCCWVWGSIAAALAAVSGARHGVRCRRRGVGDSVDLRRGGRGHGLGR